MTTTPPPGDPWSGSGSGDQPPPPPPGGYPPPPPSWEQPPPPTGGYPPPGPAAGGGYPPPPPSWQQPQGAYYGGTPSPAPGGQLAGWWQRVGASVIDFFVLLIPFIVIGALTNHSSGGRFHVNYAGGFLVDLIWVLYTGFMLGSGGQTVGNKAVHTRVVDGRTGQQVAMGRAFGRQVAQAVLLQVFVIPWILDCLWPLWDRENQTLHDKIASTVVLQS